MPSPFLTEPVIIVNPGSEASPYGGARPDWATAERVTAHGLMSQSGGDEADDAARTDDGSIFRLVLRGNPSITQESRVEYRGETFRVAGRPKKVGLRGRVSHIEVRLMPLGDT